MPIRRSFNSYERRAGKMPDQLANSDSSSNNSSNGSESRTAEKAQEPPFGANEMRLNARQWLAVALLVLTFVIGVPRLWERIERFDTPADYRNPLRPQQRLLALPSACGWNRLLCYPSAGRLGGVGRIRAVGWNAHAFPERPVRSAGKIRQLRGERPLSALDGGACRELRRFADQSESDRPLQRALDEQPEGRPEHGQGRDFQPCAARAAVLPEYPLLSGRRFHAPGRGRGAGVRILLLGGASQQRLFRSAEPSPLDAQRRWQRSAALP